MLSRGWQVAKGEGASEFHDDRLLVVREMLLMVSNIRSSLSAMDTMPEYCVGNSMFSRESGDALSHVFGKGELILILLYRLQLPA